LFLFHEALNGFFFPIFLGTIVAYVHGILYRDHQMLVVFWVKFLVKMKFKCEVVVSWEKLCIGSFGEEKFCQKKKKNNKLQFVA
jgi:hypothetical protein